MVRGERRREEREVEGGGRRMSEEEMTILLREVPLPLKYQINITLYPIHMKCFYLVAHYRQALIPRRC